MTSSLTITDPGDPVLMTAGDKMVKDLNETLNSSTQSLEDSKNLESAEVVSYNDIQDVKYNDLKGILANHPGNQSMVRDFAYTLQAKIKEHQTQMKEYYSDETHMKPTIGSGMINTAAMAQNILTTVN